MANIKLDRPSEKDLSSVGFREYMNRLLEQIEFVYQNIDEENITESYRKKIEKEKE